MVASSSAAEPKEGPTTAIPTNRSLWRVALVAVLLAFLLRDVILPPCPHGGPQHYKGKVVVITGTSSGIGVELATQLGSGGAKLVLAARRKAQLEETAKAAMDAGAQDVLVVPTDMSDPEACKALIEKTMEHYSSAAGIDLLLLNHALSEEYLFHEYNSTKEIENSVAKTMQANYMGSVHAVFAALPFLEKVEGHIAVVSSASAKTPAPFHSAYVAAKRALHGFFDTLRHEFHSVGSKVTIGILVLGMIRTPYIKQDAGLDAVSIDVDDCARQMICAIAARRKEPYVPGWMGIVTPLLMAHSGLTEMITNKAYVGEVPRYKPRLEAVAEKLKAIRGEADSDSGKGN